MKRVAGSAGGRWDEGWGAAAE